MVAKRQGKTNLTTSAAVNHGIWMIDERRDIYAFSITISESYSNNNSSNCDHLGTIQKILINTKKKSILIYHQRCIYKFYQKWINVTTDVL